MPKPELCAEAFFEAPVALMVLSNRIIREANRAVRDVFGWSAEELIGQSIRRVYPSIRDYEVTGETWLRHLSTKTGHQDERFMRHKSGEVFWVIARGVTVTPEQPFARMVWSFERARRTNEPDKLSGREWMVAQHVVNGKTSREIALTLGISRRTVEAHRAAAMRKLGAANAAELATRIIVPD